MCYSLFASEIAFFIMMGLFYFIIPFPTPEDYPNIARVINVTFLSFMKNKRNYVQL